MLEASTLLRGPRNMMVLVHSCSVGGMVVEVVVVVVVVVLGAAGGVVPLAGHAMGLPLAWGQADRQQQSSQRRRATSWRC